MVDETKTPASESTSPPKTGTAADAAKSATDTTPKDTGSDNAVDPLKGSVEPGPTHIEDEAGGVAITQPEVAQAPIIVDQNGVDRLAQVGVVDGWVPRKTEPSDAAVAAADARVKKDEERRSAYADGKVDQVSGKVQV